MTTQIDSALDKLFGTNQGESKPKSNDKSGLADVFASLMQEKIPANIVFSRTDGQLEFPQKSANSDFSNQDYTNKEFSNQDFSDSDYSDQKYSDKKYSDQGFSDQSGLDARQDSRQNARQDYGQATGQTTGRVEPNRRETASANNQERDNQDYNNQDYNNNQDHNDDGAAINDSAKGDAPQSSSVDKKNDIEVPLPSNAGAENSDKSNARISAKSNVNDEISTPNAAPIITADIRPTAKADVKADAKADAKQGAVAPATPNTPNTPVKIATPIDGAEQSIVNEVPSETPAIKQVSNKKLTASQASIAKTNATASVKANATAGVKADIGTATNIAEQSTTVSNSTKENNQNNVETPSVAAIVGTPATASIIEEPSAKRNETPVSGDITVDANATQVVEAIGDETSTIRTTPSVITAANAPTATLDSHQGMAKIETLNNATEQSTAAKATAQSLAAASKASINIEGMDTPDASEIDSLALTRQGTKGANQGQTNIQATVTTKPEPMTSQPHNTLAASAALAAQATKEGQALAEQKPSMSGEKPAIDTDNSVNNAFAKGQNQNSQNGQNNPANPQQASMQNAAKNGVKNAAKNGVKNAAKNGVQKTAAEIVSTNANANVNGLQNANFNGLLNSAINRPAAPLSGQQMASSQTVSMDPFGGVSDSPTQNTNATTKAKAVQQTRPTIPPRMVSEQIAVNIQRAIGAGNDKINIQLRPTNLGRIDVTMNVGKDGRMTAVITAEKAETLDMLKSDSKGLIQSLNDAGLKTDSNGLNFNLGADNGDASQFASKNGDKDKQSEKEPDLDDTENPIDGASYLEEGQTAQLDDDGHLDVNV